MSRFEKAKDRLRSIPKDYTYSEAKFLLLHLGFEERNKGKTSGSRVAFHRQRDNKDILLHKPHAGDVMSIANTRDLHDYLKEIGEL